MIRFGPVDNSHTLTVGARVLQPISMQPVLTAPPAAAPSPRSALFSGTESNLCHKKHPV